MTTRRHLLHLSAGAASMALLGATATSAAAQGLKGGNDNDDEEQAPLENEWLSPGLGLAVSWSDAWIATDRSEEGSPVNIPESENIILKPADAEDINGQLWIFVHDVFSVYGNAEAALDQFEAEVDPERVLAEVEFITAFEILALERTDDTLAVVSAYQTGSAMKLEIRECRVIHGGDRILDSSLSMQVESFAPYYELAQSDVLVEGVQPFGYFSDADVLELAGSDFGEASDPDPNEDPVEDPDQGTDGDDPDSGGGDATALADVRDTADAWNASVGEFLEIIATESLTDAQADRANEILAMWSNAPTVASGADLGTGNADIEAAYLDYANSLADAANAFYTFFNPDSTEAVRDQAGQDFQDALNDAGTNAAVLDDLLTAAGA